MICFPYINWRVFHTHDHLYLYPRIIWQMFYMINMYLLHTSCTSNPQFIHFLPWTYLYMYDVCVMWLYIQVKVIFLVTINYVVSILKVILLSNELLQSQQSVRNGLKRQRMLLRNCFILMILLLLILHIATWCIIANCHKLQTTFFIWKYMLDE